MLHTRFAVALLAFTSLTVLQANQAHSMDSNYDIEATAHVGGYASQHNTIGGQDAVLDTMLGSASASDNAKIKANADIGGNFRIQNNDANAVLTTKVGSVGSGSRSVDVLSSVSGNGDFNADARVGGDVFVYNTGANSAVTTDIGSIEGKVTKATAMADIGGSVIHKNRGDNNLSALMVGFRQWSSPITDHTHYLDVFIYNQRDFHVTYKNFFSERPEHSGSHICRTGPNLTADRWPQFEYEYGRR